MIFHGGEPFLLPGGQHGVLLIHGFTGFPAEMSLLADYLHKKGYTVLGVRLAGHGTTPMDMFHTTGDDWYSSVCDGYSLLMGICSKVSVVGLSMGATLALLFASDNPVEGCCSLAAPIFIHQDTQLYRLPAKEICIQKKMFWPKHRRTLQNIPQVCYNSYGEMPMVCVHELLELIEKCKKALPRIKCPLLVIQSNNDHTVRPQSGQYIYNRAGSYEKELVWLEESGHMLTLDCERDTVFNKVGDFLEKIGDK